MPSRPSIRSVLVVVLLIAAACSSVPPDRDVSPLPVDAAVAGMSQPELTRQWWQWAGSFDADKSPVADVTGERCGAGQEGPVWFLAGTYGSRPTHRTCRMPAGKYVFFRSSTISSCPPAAMVVQSRARACEPPLAI